MIANDYLLTLNVASARETRVLFWPLTFRHANDSSCAATKVDCGLETDWLKKTKKNNINKVSVWVHVLVLIFRMNISLGAIYYWWISVKLLPLLFPVKLDVNISGATTPFDAAAAFAGKTNDFAQ